MEQNSREEWEEWGVENSLYEIGEDLEGRKWLTQLIDGSNSIQIDFFQDNLVPNQPVD